MNKTPNPIDRHVGARVRMRRLMVGLSQSKLAESLDVTFQQVQKYEKGANRIGASRLQQLARVLDVPPAFFFDGAPASATFNGLGNLAPAVTPPPVKKLVTKKTVKCKKGLVKNKQGQCVKSKPKKHKAKKSNRRAK